MSADVTITIDNDIVPALVEFCSNADEVAITLVADDNTYAALGKRVEAALQDANLTVTTIVHTGDEIIADEHYLMQTLLQSPPEEQLFLAVGSGTLTDITRYISYRTGNRLVSVPTAPSVDGFISLGAPLVVGGLKQTYLTHTPTAVFADLSTLAAAPADLIAAGFGDILGKATSLADWKLAHLLWDEPFDEAVYQRVHHAYQRCMNAADAIGNREPEGIRLLIEALLESGIGMVEYGGSRPASGSEHHCSHYWEMRLLREDKPAILHGLKVGYAAKLMATCYHHLHTMTPRQMTDALESATYEQFMQQDAQISAEYDDLAADIRESQEAYLSLSEEEYDAVKRRIAEQWSQVREILREVPTPDDVTALLNAVHAPTDRESLGISDTYQQGALTYGHFLRARFTVFKLMQFMGVDAVAVNAG